MNHTVPDFEANEDYLLPELHKKSSMSGGNEEVMELLWHNGQVVNKRLSSQQTHLEHVVATTVNREVREVGPSSDLFMREDEMASWLHYPSDENSLEEYLYNNDLLYPMPPVTTASATLEQQLPPPPSVMSPSSRPPVSQLKSVEKKQRPPKHTNFMHFARPVKRFNPELGQSSSSKMTLPLTAPSTVVASNETPTKAQESRASRVSDKPTPMNIGHGVGVGVAGTSSARKETETGEMSVTSSPSSGGGSRGPPPLPSDDKKRKCRDTDYTECHNEVHN